MPVPTAPPPAAKGRAGSRSAPPAVVAADETEAAPEPARPSKRPKPAEQTDAPTAARPHMVNDLLPFLGFVERHPVGSSVTAIVESYSSHGAYVTLGEARGYVPLRLMADPVPRSAREVMKVGDEVELVVVSFNATRRSIDLCVPGMEPAEVKALASAPAPPAPAKRTRKKAAAPVLAPPPAEVAAEAAAEAAELAAATPAKRTRKKAAAAAPAEQAAPEPAAAEPPPVPAKRTRKKAAAPERPVVEPAVVEPAVAESAAAPTPARKAATTRPRKKAVAPPDVPTSLDGSEPAVESSPPVAAPAPPAAKRTRKKAVPA
jgi:predicted RNA-binding protein with RPS1 domain